MRTRSRLARRTTLLLCTAVLALPLAGCTVEGPEAWRYHGDPLLQAEADLTIMTTTWRDQVRTARGARALPADSACYLRISAPHDVDDEIVCGPLLGDGARWESARIAGYYERDGKVALGMIEAPEGAFSDVADRDLGTLRAADGSAPDTDADPVAPDLPALAPGEVRALSDGPDGGAVWNGDDPDPARDDGYRVIDAGSQAYLVRLRPADPAVEPEVDVTAPAGSRLMVVEAFQLWDNLQQRPEPEATAGPLVMTVRGGDAGEAHEVELPGASEGAPQVQVDPETGGQTITLRAGSDPRWEGPRWIIAVPDGQEVQVEVTDGSHRAHAGSAPGDVSSDFPRLETYTGEVQLVSTAAADGQGLGGSFSLAPSLQLQRNLRPQDGPSHAEVTVQTYDPSAAPDGGAAEPLQWYRDGQPIAEYTSSTATIVDPVLELDGRPTATKAAPDPSMPTQAIHADVQIAPGAEPVLTIRGTLRTVLSEPSAVAGPGYDGTVPDGVPEETVLETLFVLELPVSAAAAGGPDLAAW